MNVLNTNLNERKNDMIKKYKIKDQRSVFGNLEFLSFEETVKETSGSGRFARNIVIGNRYGLLSDVQDDVSVIIHGSVPKVDYNFRAPVELINPVLVATGRSAGRGAYIDWHVEADGIKLRNTL